VSRRDRGAHAAPQASAAATEAAREERERLRQQTRELHEAAQEALDARRQLAAAMTEIRNILDMTAAEHRADFTAQLNEQAARLGEQWKTDLTAGLDQVADTAYARLADYLQETVDLAGRAYGWKSWDDVRDALVKSVIRALAANPRSLTAIPDDGIDLMRSLHPERLPDIIVTTPDMVDAVRAADPDRIILDST
jgi:hypothetical protein